VSWSVGSRRRLRRLFLEGFSVMDVAEPLVSVDAERRSDEVRDLLEAEAFDLVGIRRAGRVVGYAQRDDLRAGTCGRYLRPFGPDDLVEETASLRDAILSLGINHRCFVTVLGDPAAIVTVSDLEKPPTRMFLFGMITVLEALMTGAIGQAYPDEGWQGILTSGRLAKAKELHAERRRRGQAGTLVDCLQFSDKGRILLSLPAIADDPALLDGQSRKASKRALQELETLRNNLAHSQQIIPDAWERIVRFSARLEALLDAGPLDRVEPGTPPAGAPSDAPEG